MLCLSAVSSLPRTNEAESIMTPDRPHVVAILPGIIPSTLMDIVQPLLHLDGTGEIKFHLMVEQYPTVGLIGGMDLVVFCRNAEPRYQYLDLVLERGCPFIYDLDDNLFEVPLDSVDGQYYSDPERAELIRRYLRSADLVRVYSKTLVELVKPLNPKVQEMVPPLDWRLYQSQTRESRDGPVRIVYATSRRDDYLFTVFDEALVQILDKYSDRVEVYFWGFHPPSYSQRANVHFLDFTYNYEQYARQLSSMGFDIGLAPLLDDRFHRSKTNTKFREYGACGIAGIYSDVEVYARWVEDHKTGLLVPNTPQAWFAALETLITDSALRQTIGQAAREKVRQTFSTENFAVVWKEQIRQSLEDARRAASPETAQLSNKGAASKTEPGRKTFYRDWLVSKARRAIIILREGGLGAAWYHVRFHTNNLWWLFKVNLLKRT